MEYMRPIIWRSIGNILGFGVAQGNSYGSQYGNLASL